MKRKCLSILAATIIFASSSTSPLSPTVNILLTAASTASVALNTGTEPTEKTHVTKYGKRMSKPEVYEIERPAIPYAYRAAEEILRIIIAHYLSRQIEQIATAFAIYVRRRLTKDRIEQPQYLCRLKIVDGVAFNGGRHSLRKVKKVIESYLPMT